MSYEFSFGAFFVGFLILAAGVLFVRYYQWVADNFGNGVNSYERYKLWALSACLLGFFIMLNLHTPLLEWLVSALLHR